MFAIVRDEHIAHIGSLAFKFHYVPTPFLDSPDINYSSIGNRGTCNVFGLATETQADDPFVREFWAFVDKGCNPATCFYVEEMGGFITTSREVFSVSRKLDTGHNAAVFEGV